MKTPIGTIVPNDNKFTRKYRQHQGWWRTFVLNAEEGTYPNPKNKKISSVCNRINNGKENGENFLSDEIKATVNRSVEDQKKDKSGIIEQDRLYNNLLSSQPLAFNFFGFFMAHKEAALAFLKTIRPGITELVNVVFEYAPADNTDHSAFDFGFIVKEADRKGFIGFECKYTDTFSYRRLDNGAFYGDDNDKNYEEYHRLYTENPERFPDDYWSYVRDPRFNQLFRNELLGVRLKNEYDFVLTGLFCHHDDNKSTEAGIEFAQKVGNRKDDFLLLTYRDYFEKMQKLDLSWEERELVMMLWARYCGVELSREWVE